MQISYKVALSITLVVAFAGGVATGVAGCGLGPSIVGC
jgi:hypothetical protein